MADKFPLLDSSKPKTLSNNIGRTIRIDVDLKNPKNRYPVFNYEQLLKEALKKEALAKKKEANGNGKDPKDDPDNDDDVRRIANQFEEKYGKTSKKYNSYKELGAGYDENDSFIDNTDLCDDGLPENLDTAKGGFYVNTGKLEFTKLYDQG